ncbi:hypothetical protein PV08_02496 [Exophiala spinifera]|uniref:Uncharacterized protein n=1 Tax=Exophiala spinifera TaxID=91928 RepID=A0A0D2BGS4_9EURO|nr:uncharacterized protein PV08_02496 [Exophiala spinifera]KIW18208.1 hypothetical protein PV08_02496 [Exophiala spinifera]
MTGNNNNNNNKAFPIAAFKQVHGHFERGRTFEFDAYYRIVKLAFLEPRSPGLIRMLEQKWSRNRFGTKTPKMRDKNEWHSSLNRRWAVVKFERYDSDSPQAEALDPPHIARNPDSFSAWKETRSVNELLKELRMKDLEAGNGDKK